MFCCVMESPTKATVPLRPPAARHVVSTSATLPLTTPLQRLLKSLKFWKKQGWYCAFSTEHSHIEYSGFMRPPYRRLYAAS